MLNLAEEARFQGAPGEHTEKWRMNLLYLDTGRVPFYIGAAHPFIIFNPATTKMAYENSQLVVKEATFYSPSPTSHNAPAALVNKRQQGGIVLQKEKSSINERIFSR